MGDAVGDAMGDVVGDAVGDAVGAVVGDSVCVTGLAVVDVSLGDEEGEEETLGDEEGEEETLGDEEGEEESLGELLGAAVSPPPGRHGAQLSKELATSVQAACSDKPSSSITKSMRARHENPSTSVSRTSLVQRIVPHLPMVADEGLVVEILVGDSVSSSSLVVGGAVVSMITLVGDAVGDLVGVVVVGEGVG